MLKKICASLFALTLFACIWISYSKPLFSSYANGYEVYGETKSAGQIKLASDKNFHLFFLRYGESATLKVKGDENFALSVIKEFNGELIFIEKIAEGTSYYAYSSDIKYCEVINGKKINLHIFVQEEGQTTLGSPVIYGSF